MDNNENNEFKVNNKNDNIDRSVPDDENYYKDGQNHKDDIFDEINKNLSNRNANNSQLNHYEYVDISSGKDYYSFDNKENFTSLEEMRNNANTPPRNNNTKKRKKKNKGKNICISIFVVLISLILVIAIFAAGIISPVFNKINHQDLEPNKYVNASDLHRDANVKNVLLIGVDARANQENNESRSDTMMLISLDKNHHCIKMTSFMRDSWVKLPFKESMQKLNASCMFGGYQGVVDTIEKIFAIDIDGYIVTDFNMFKVMIDSMGGIEIDVTEKEAKEVTNHHKVYGNVDLPAGKNNLTGKQALAYARIRHIDTDWKRTERQRTVIEAIIKKAISGGPITLYNTAKSVAPYIVTSFSNKELVNIATSALSCVTGGIYQTACPFDGTWKYKSKRGMDVIAFNEEENKEKLFDYIYNKSASDLKVDENDD